MKTILYYTLAAIVVVVASLAGYVAFGWHSWKFTSPPAFGRTVTYHDDRADVTIVANGSVVSRITLLRFARTTFGSDGYRSVRLKYNDTLNETDLIQEVLCFGTIPNMSPQMAQHVAVWYIALPASGPPDTVPPSLGGVLLGPHSDPRWDSWCKQHSIVCVHTSANNPRSLTVATRQMQMAVSEARYEERRRQAQTTSAEHISAQ